MAGDPLVVIQKAKDDVVKLASMTPSDPQAINKVEEITGAINTLAGLVAPLIPDKYKLWVGVVVGVLVGGLGGYVGKGTPPVQPPAVVNVTTNSPVQPPVSTKTKLTFYLTAAPVKAFMDDPALKKYEVTVEPTVFQEGSTYPWKGQQLALPVVAVSRGGAVVDVLPVIGSAADLAKEIDGVK